MNNVRLQLFRKRLEIEVRDGILAFWARYAVDTDRGGFIGVIRTPNVPDPEGPRSLVLNARILWTFAIAHRVLGDADCLQLAERAYDYLQAHFKDPVHGGYYWMLHADGHPLERNKVVYGNAFVLYALAEFHRATRREDVLEEAIAHFLLLDAHAHDPRYGGYVEGFAEDWTPIGIMALSAKDLRAEKTMNTHLHVLEAFTNLLRVFDDPRLRVRLRETIEVMADHVYDSREDRFQSYFDRQWAPLGDITSFGHDIEGSWLLAEAASVLGDGAWKARIDDISIRMARRALSTGMDPHHGGMYDEIHGGVLRDGKIWWVQAEAIVGFTHAWQTTGEEAFLDAAFDTWLFTDAHLVDHVHGEWFGATDAAGKQTHGRTTEDSLKTGPWKCPYHNARMCFEMMERLEHAMQNEKKTPHAL